MPTTALSALLDAGIELADFSMGSPSLDEVFFALTGEKQLHERSSRQVARSAGARPQLSNALVFGWRAVLKFKHVPEQLFDLVMTPIMFTLLFTFVFGGALAGSPRDLSTGVPARHPRADRGVQCRVLGHGPVHRPRQGIVRPLPLAADLAAGAVRGPHGRRHPASPDRRRHHPHHRPDPGLPARSRVAGRARRIRPADRHRFRHGLDLHRARAC